MTSRMMGWRDTLAPTLSLFASTSTLVCCALPALFVTLGMGAALAGLVASAPWLVALTRYKEWLFAGSALMLLGAWAMHRRSARLPCPADPARARACARLRRISGATLAVSALVWAVGFFFAFLAAEVLL
ncbi:MAG: hypothetical protein SNJ79_06915 [Sphingomonadaceae bacterium]